jgi:hypothetical protein
MVVLLVHVNRAGSARAVCADRFVATVVMKDMPYEDSYGIPHAAIFTAVKRRVRLWQNVVPTYTRASSGAMAVPLLGGWSS